MTVSRLVIGDHYAAQFQLKTTLLPGGYDITAWERLAATVVNEDHSVRLCDVIEQVPTEEDQLNIGLLTVQFTEEVTEQLRKSFNRRGYALVEVKVEIVGREFTWWHDIEVVPGYID